MIWLRRLALVAVLLLALVLLAWAGVPPLVKWQGEQRLSRALGRAVTIGAVHFTPWRLALEIDDLAIAGLDGQPSQLSAQRLLADLDVQSLWTRGPVLEALEIDAPQLRIARLAPGRYDVDDLIRRFTPAPDAPPSDEPMRFALHNLRIADGAVRFDDRVAHQVHEVARLLVTLPFVSNLPADVATLVEPRVAFTLDGTAFDTGAQATPFRADRASTLHLRIGGDAPDAALDLTPFLGYWPPDLPAKPVRARLGGTLDVAFALRADGTPSLKLSGHVALDDVAAVDAAGAPLVAWQRLSVALADVQPLARRVMLGAVTLKGPDVHLARDPDGRLAIAPAASAPASAAASAPAAASAAPGWQAGIESLAIEDGRMHWRDASISPAAAFDADGVALAVHVLRWPIAGPVDVKAAARVVPAPAAGADAATLSLEGRAGPADVQLGWSMQGIALGWFAPYLAPVLAVPVQGLLRGTGRIDWAAASAPSPRLAITVDTARLERARIGAADGGAALAALDVAGSRIDVAARTADLGTVRLSQPSTVLARDADGRWNFEAWRAATVPLPTPTAAPTAQPWQLRLAELKIDGGRFGWRDARPRVAPGATVPAAALDVSAVDVTASGLAWGGEPTTPARVQLSAAVSTPTDRDRRPGQVTWKGELAPAPLLARGALTVRRLPLHPLEGYVDNPLRVDVARAYVGWDGNVAVTSASAGLSATAQGELRLVNVSVLAQPGTAEPAPAGGSAAVPDELFGWQRLALTGFDFKLAPGARPSLAIAQAEVADLYSRLAITEDGQLNLRQLTPAEKASVAAAAPAASAASAPALPPAPAPVDWQLGGVVVHNARVDFSDHFVKPNYSASLTELEGTLGAVSSSTQAMAPLSLRGRAEGSALLEISGAVDPAARPPVLDIRAKATDLELAPLSPYAGKYAGYEIERGKLSMDVAYKITPDGRLDARNQVVLNQLTFGDKVESPQATTLPVRLAVALLKDRNGVIDLNLPVSGSLQDPQFSVIGLVWRVLGNLLVKAVTSPFALLGGGGGGGGEDASQQIEFRPGTARFADGQQAVLAKVAKALGERPALKMTVTGQAGVAAEAEAYRRAVLEQQLVAERRRELVRAGGKPDAPVTLEPADRTRLLGQLYKRADLPDKPRNVLGLLKDLPDDEMAARLAADKPATPEAMRTLAVQRGLAVRDALIAQGLPSDRLFLAAPQVDEGDGAASRATLELSVD